MLLLFLHARRLQTSELAQAQLTVTQGLYLPQSNARQRGENRWIDGSAGRSGRRSLPPTKTNAFPLTCAHGHTPPAKRHIKPSLVHHGCDNYDRLQRCKGRCPRARRAQSYPAQAEGCCKGRDGCARTMPRHTTQTFPWQREHVAQMNHESGNRGTRVGGAAMVADLAMPVTVPAETDSFAGVPGRTRPSCVEGCTGAPVRWIAGPIPPASSRAFCSHAAPHVPPFPSSASYVGGGRCDC